ncbi:flagellin lysine-N-methylase [Eubacterium oxidoreducens]|uniref:Lysine-N-methylase n=1 Tax=Eubacterium oxidoreducens TaxID=1732 RepID=A0A1G6A5S7_EUBOX|nr:flagellin lysine-N-methylase [Eubacterium oxidoreducens]SDB03646.1 lysine-N-methylase [Eubacterium oxidoreducens]
MMRVRPGYMSSFRCLADRCTDSCCIGWEIDIDEETLAYYESMSGAIGNKLRENIEKQKDSAYFKLTKKERCPFLNAQNLCEIILELGEDHICQICTDHPRYYDWMASRMEEGIGLACEEAARLILDSPMALESEGEEEKEGSKQELLRERYLLAVRDEILERISKATDYKELEQKLVQEVSKMQIAYKSWCEKHELAYEGPAKASILLRSYKELIKRYKELEINQPKWRKLLEEMEEDPKLFRDILYEKNENVQSGYRHLLYYFVYRYFMQARYDDDLVGKLRLALYSIRMMEAQDAYIVSQKGRLTKWERICNYKLYSQEIEYCEDNVIAIADML